MQATPLKQDSPRASHSRLLDSTGPEQSLPSRHLKELPALGLLVYPSPTPLKGLQGAHELRGTVIVP